MKIGNKYITITGMVHYFRLIFRCVLFLIGVVVYLTIRLRAPENIISEVSTTPVFLIVIWVIFAIEMVLRFFPSKYESPGCQKQFAHNFKKRVGKPIVTRNETQVAMLIALVWLVMNVIFGMLKIKGVFDDGIMILICLAFSVCDMICILFFCPFQTWFLKNKCCVTCRIYNWDYAMMFTPLFFVANWYSWSLLFLSIALLFRWEFANFRYPERFSENDNEYLSCKNCTEKLCSHKKQLIAFRKELAAIAREKEQLALAKQKELVAYAKEKEKEVNDWAKHHQHHQRHVK